MKDGPTMTIIVDTREQRPFTFREIKTPAVPFTVTTGTLDTGDYSVETDLLATPGDKIVVERKSLADLYGSLSAGRVRFAREAERLAEYGYAAIVIEADYPTIMQPSNVLRYPTSMNPRSVIATLIAWSQRYDIHVYACPGRHFAEQLTYRLLERWFRDHEPTLTRPAMNTAAYRI
jgi:ERCC4-type nuclease